MKLKPMADNILLRAAESQETTASGIILATANKEKPGIYEVVSAGPGTKDVTVTVKAGEPVKIMALAAELLGEPGLKYTYAEAYEVVKNFNCGVYFTPEFLAALARCNHRVPSTSKGKRCSGIRYYPYR